MHLAPETGAGCIHLFPQVTDREESRIHGERTTQLLLRRCGPTGESQVFAPHYSTEIRKSLKMIGHSPQEISDPGYSPATQICGYGPSCLPTQLSDNA